MSRVGVIQNFFIVLSYSEKTACLGKIRLPSYGQKWLSINEISVLFNCQYFINRSTQDLNKIKQILSTLVKTLVIRNYVRNFNKNLVVGARQSRQFLRQYIWFIKSNRVLSKFLYGILRSLISITKLSATLVHISKFYIIHVSHLNVWLVSDQAPLVLELRIF